MNYPTAIKKTYKKQINYGNRGMDLENFINQTNEYYLEKDIAVIYKKPTPIQVVKYNYDKWTAYINGQYVSSRNTEKMVGGKLYAEDGFFTADAGLSYKFMKNGTISFAVNNIFDRDYWQWYKADGRSWNVGVDFTF